MCRFLETCSFDSQSFHQNRGYLNAAVKPLIKWNPDEFPKDTISDIHLILHRSHACHICIAEALNQENSDMLNLSVFSFGFQFIFKLFQI